MHRTWAIIERELRRFRRSPTLIIMSLFFPIVQLVVLGNAFGGIVKHLKVAVVDQDRGIAPVKLRELCNAVASGARTFETIDYSDEGRALDDLRNGGSTACSSSRRGSRGCSWRRPGRGWRSSRTTRIPSYHRRCRHHSAA